MVSDFVRENVSAGELAGRAKLLFQRVEERQVDVDLAIVRAVERADRGTLHTARGLHLIGEQNQGRLLVDLAHHAKLLVPDVLSVLEDHLGKLGHPLFGGVLGSRYARLAAAAAAHELPRINAQHQGEQDHDESSATAHDGTGRDAPSAAVIHVRALLAPFPFHVRPSPELESGRRSTCTAKDCRGAISRKQFACQLIIARHERILPTERLVGRCRRLV